MDKIVFYLVQKRRKNRIENNTKPRGNQTRYIKYGKKNHTERRTDRDTQTDLILIFR